MAYGTSFPTAGQQAFENNRNLLKRSGIFDPQSNNQFINAPKLKSEMTLDLLKQLQSIKKEKIAQARRTKYWIAFSSMIFFLIVTLVYFIF